MSNIQFSDLYNFDGCRQVWDHGIGITLMKVWYERLPDGDVKQRVDIISPRLEFYKEDDNV